MRGLIPALFVLAGVAAGAGPPNSDLSTLQYGIQVLGPPVVPEKLAGKVVLLDFWGTQCIPCLAAMPGLAEFEKKHRGSPLRVIAFESQKSEEGAVLDVCRENGVEYTVFLGGSYPGKELRSLPRAFVFDPMGRQIDRKSVV